jgi:flagellar motor protein MotB
VGLYRTLLVSTRSSNLPKAPPTMSIRRTMIRLTITAAAASAALLGGCVSQDEYDNATTTASSQEAQIQRLLQERQQLDNTLDELRAENAALRGENAQIAEQRDALNARIAALRQQIAGIETQLGNISTSALDPETDLALQRLVSRFPDLLSYDSQRGMIRVASDLTFASGSDAVRDAAKPGLEQLARVMQSSTADAYAIRVVGHTDSQRISNPNTLRRFPTNRHLSVARAIAVSNSLQDAGLAGERIETSGWGPHRPAVANNPRGGTPANRRVEIFIVPDSQVPAAGMGASITNETPADPMPQDPAPARRDFPTK